MQEKENVLRIFEETKRAVEENDSLKIKSLSNQTINTASLTHDPDNIMVAVVVYSLSKIIERENYRELPGWNEFYKRYLAAINKIIISLKKSDEKGVRENLKLIRQAIGKLSGKLKKYIQDVFVKAKINKASKIYEHGISMERTARLLGVTMFDLASYAGQTDISDVPENKTLGISQRIKLVENFFK